MEAPELTNWPSALFGVSSPQQAVSSVLVFRTDTCTCTCTCTQSELVRAHGLRHARYRGLAKVKLQSYFIGAACNVKRWLRLEAWKLRQAALASAAARATATAG